ncbi:hypothetical protein [Bryobacter aggregatus]|uniref:hypothetical protein n=1 Tax=Bryobacter aggregatus TaxID=360054 RepID=UPI0012BADACE|nr:hypothetical protein [Bryobacter aggregatus]
MLRRILLLAVPAAMLLAADKPDYSGHWVIDTAKSDFGPMPAPEKMERDIDHKDPQMKVKSLQKSERGEFTTDSQYTTDGKESTVQMRGREAKVSAKWNGNKLEVHTKSEFNGMALTQKESWSLSGDGKTLTINNEIQSPQGEFTMKSVFTKGS